MSTYRFKLEPYKGVKTRHTCPACKRSRCFARYIDTEGVLTFPDHVGRCDHEQRCGYHYTPKASSQTTRRLGRDYRLRPKWSSSLASQRPRPSLIGL